MNLPGQQSPDSTLPSYDLSRSLGLQAGTDLDFKKLAAQLDCTRNTHRPLWGVHSQGLSATHKIPSSQGVM